MKLTKEEFKNILKEMQDLYRKQDNFCRCLESMADSEIIPAFIFGKSLDMIQNLLAKMLDDENDDIGYFLYELDAINSENLEIEKDYAPTDESGNILYYDEDSLYNYLTGGKE